MRPWLAVTVAAACAGACATAQAPRAGAAAESVALPDCYAELSASQWSRVAGRVSARSYNSGRVMVQPPSPVLKYWYDDRGGVRTSYVSTPGTWIHAPSAQEHLDLRRSRTAHRAAATAADLETKRRSGVSGEALALAEREHQEAMLAFYRTTRAATGRGFSLCPGLPALI